MKLHLAAVAVLAVASTAAAVPADTVARTIWGEARGESSAGRRAVASVIWTRARGRPARLEGVCLARRQFSCWNAGRVTVRIRSERDRRVWAECRALAGQMERGAFQPTLKATHYHAAYVSPRWARGMTLAAVVGGHRFYRRA